MSELEEKSLISFEAVAFLAGIAASLMSVNQAALQGNPEMKVISGFINFLIGMSLACFGGIIVTRLITKVEITEADPAIIRFVEALLLAGGIIFLMTATGLVCIQIEPYSGVAVCTVGTVVIIIAFVAHIGKQSLVHRKERKSHAARGKEQQSIENPLAKQADQV